PAMSRWPEAALPRRRGWAVRITLTVWVGVLVFILVRAYFQPRRNSVYPIFGNAGREWTGGVDLYDRTIDRADLDTFRYLPIIGAWFAPFGALPDNLGGVLWRVVNGAVFLGGFVVFVRAVVP